MPNPYTKTTPILEQDNCILDSLTTTELEDVVSFADVIETLQNDLD